MIRRFRDRNEPIRLFGESDYEGYLRLKRLETDEPDAREVTNFIENTGLQDYKICSIVLDIKNRSNVVNTLYQDF